MPRDDYDGEAPLSNRELRLRGLDERGDDEGDPDEERRLDSAQRARDMNAVNRRLT